MDNTTCKNCVHRRLIAEPGSRELVSFCTRHPPQTSAIPTPQGIVMLTVHPKVGLDYPSCGEFEPLEDELDSEGPASM